MRHRPSNRREIPPRGLCPDGWNCARVAAVGLVAAAMVSGSLAGPPLPGRPADSGKGPRHVPAKVLRYAGRLIRNYDSQYGNGDGRLEPGEWGTIYDMTGAQPQLADYDGDGIITLEEIAQHVADYGHPRRIRLVNPLVREDYTFPSLLNPAAPSLEEYDQPPVGNDPAVAPWAGSEPESPAARPPPNNRRFYVPPSRLKGLPEWFVLRDANGDGQLTLSEFAVQPTREQLDQFVRYDRNGDGVITTREYLAGAAAPPPPSPAEDEEREEESPET